MSCILRVAAVGIVLAFAATGVAQARPMNQNHPHPGFAGPVYSSVEASGRGFARSAQRRDGYDGGRYWWGGDCWPTESGGCD